MRKLWSSTALVLIAALRCHPAFAGPEGGVTIGGSAVIEKAGRQTTIQQSSNRAILRWNSFDVAGNESVIFNQPSKSSITVNRIQDSKASQIDGRITAPGTILLLNANGVLFGKTARVDVGGLIAASSDLDDDDLFMAGGPLALTRPGQADARIINKGNITIRNAGLGGFVAPHVRNEGIITAKMGKITLAGGDMATFDLAGDGLISIAVSTDTLSRSVINTGILKAEGGDVLLSAATARDLVDSLIDNTGRIETASIGQQTGSITIKGEGATVKNTGVIKAEGQTGEQGGTIDIDADFVALGGTISADGAAGGSVTIAAKSLSLAGDITARGRQGAGGSVQIDASGNTFVTSTSRIDASGRGDGGSIRAFTGYNLVSSGIYTATGLTGSGGQIDMTGGGVKLLSASVDASGGRGGGEIRIGGEYQGGKDLPPTRDDIPNAQIVTLDRSTRLRADGENTDSEGGRIIVWSDLDTLALGDIFARPGTRSGAGGFVELSSGENLNYGATIQTGRGNRAGQVLLDPKNIIIADATFSSTAIIMGRGYSAPNIDTPHLNGTREIGLSVSLDGNRMAVGAHLDYGFSSTAASAASGAVYLYSFTDSSFSGGVLEGIIGHGYTGGKNIDTSATMNALDAFGVAVSLDGNRLAVGASADDGNANALGNSGAVYLFTFSDAAFTGGTLQARIGHNYTGGKNINMAGLLNSSDAFGRAVSLDGNQLAVGANSDDGFLNNRDASGGVHLFTFTDATFSGGSHQGRIGYGYAATKDIDLTSTLDPSDTLGSSLSLDNGRLVVSTGNDDGADNTISTSGAAYLFTFSDLAFNGGALAGIIGRGYTGGASINETNIASNDEFGFSVALDGNRLFVGAVRDDANGNSRGDSGAVYMYSFTDSQFNGGLLEGRIGYNYAALGGKNVSRVNEADTGDTFGYALAVDGQKLVVSSAGDDGPFANSNSFQGAFHYYTFSDLAFNGLTYQGTIGTGYTGGKNLTFPFNTSASGQGEISIALDANRIALGFASDDGFSNGAYGSGAVYLYSFASSDFDGAVLESIIGYGYTGGKNVDMTAFLGAGDGFGSSVSLDGNRLAVGAPTDDGNANALGDSGAVYLFSFSDSTFSDGTLQSRIGRNYTGGKNFNPTNLVNTSDLFGSAVSLDGNRLAVGAYGDDGLSNARSASGAVYLFSFADSLFTTPTQQALIGYNYTGGKNVNLSQLDVSDNVGRYGLSLDGNRLAITAVGDDGFGNTASDAGAAYLFSFADSLFITPILQATVGVGYTGGKNINVANMAAGDALSSVALEGNVLALGAAGDDGLTNNSRNVGAIYIYAFSDNLFSNGNLDAIFGSLYTGGKNIFLGQNTDDLLGRGLDLNQGTLVTSLPGADGSGNAYSGSTEFYIFRGNSFAPSAGGTFANLSTGTVGITPGALSALLSTPQDVTLQASNDILLNNNLTVNNASGDGGTLTLQAGRSITINADIITDNGNLNLYANEDLSAGVVNAQREAGAATITMTPGTTINAGTGTVTLRLEDGTGKTHRTSGNIVINNIIAGNLLARSIDPTSSVVVNGVINTSDIGTPLTLAPGKDFINNYGAGALLTPSGRWLVYSDSPILDTLGGLSPAFSYYNCIYGGACAPDAGNGIFYQYGPNLISVSVNTSRAYGDANPDAATLQSLFSFEGFQNGDDVTDLDLLPSVSLAGTATATATAGSSHAITLSGGSDDFYSYYFLDPSALSILQKTVTATWNGPLTKAYGDGNPNPVVSSLFSYSGLANSETAGVITASTIDLGGVNTLTGVGTYAISATLTATNYNFIIDPGQFIVTPRALTATWTGGLSRIYGDANPAVSTANFTYSGLVNGDLGTVVTASGDFGAITTATDVGSYTVGATFSATNYTVSNAPTTTLTINKRDITATVNNANRIYGEANPTLGWADIVWNNLANSETGSVIDSFTLASPTALATSNAGTNHAITLSGFSDNNYNLTGSTAGTLSIGQRDITATVNNASRAYGDANPALGWADVVWNNLANSETGSVIDTFALTSPTALATSNAGTIHAITLGGFSDNNYNLTSSTPGSLTINKRDITATVNNASRAYGDANPTLGWADIAWSNLANSETGSVIDTFTLTNPTALATSNAGTNHAITLSGFSDNNYNLTSSTAGTLSIDKRDITASVNNASRAYGDANPTLSWADVVWNNLANSETGSVIDAFTLTSPTALATSNADTIHAITLGGFNDNNYNLTGSTPGTLTINKRLLTGSIDNASRAYGDSNPVFANTLITWGNFANSEDASLLDAYSLGTSTALATSNAGTTHNITVSGFSDNNYDIGAVTAGTLTITKRDITADVGNATRVYGDANPTLGWANATWYNLANGETGSVLDALSITAPTALVTSNAGTTHDLDIASFSDNNYNLISSTPGSLSITQAPVIIRAEPQTRTTQGTDPVLSYTADGLRNGDAAAVISNILMSTTALSTSPAGSYVITASGGTALNYFVDSYIDGVFTITGQRSTDAIPSSVNRTLSQGDNGTAGPSPQSSNYAGFWGSENAGVVIDSTQPTTSFTVVLDSVAVPGAGPASFAQNTLIAITERLKLLLSMN